MCAFCVCSVRCCKPGSVQGRICAPVVSILPPPTNHQQPNITQAVEAALADAWVRGGDLLGLQRRYLRLGKPPRRWKRPPWSQAAAWEPPEVVITARPLNNTTGLKSRCACVFVGGRGGASVRLVIVSLCGCWHEQPWVKLSCAHSFADNVRRCSCSVYVCVCFCDCQVLCARQQPGDS